MALQSDSLINIKGNYTFHGIIYGKFNLRTIICHGKMKSMLPKGTSRSVHISGSLNLGFSATFPTSLQLETNFGGMISHTGRVHIIKN